MRSSRRIETPQISKMLEWGCICTDLLVGYILTICARRYICAWLAVRVGLDGLPRRTACWDILVGVELMLWARLISWAAAGEVVRLIYRERKIRLYLDTSHTVEALGEKCPYRGLCGSCLLGWGAVLWGALTTSCDTGLHWGTRDRRKFRIRQQHGYPLKRNDHSNMYFTCHVHLLYGSQALELSGA